MAERTLTLQRTDHEPIVMDPRISGFRWVVELARGLDWPQSMRDRLVTGAFRDMVNSFGDKRVFDDLAYGQSAQVEKLNLGKHEGRSVVLTSLGDFVAYDGYGQKVPGVVGWELFAKNGTMACQELYYGKELDLLTENLSKLASKAGTLEQIDRLRIGQFADNFVEGMRIASREGRSDLAKADSARFLAKVALAAVEGLVFSDFQIGDSQVRALAVIGDPTNHHSYLLRSDGSLICTWSDSSHDRRWRFAFEQEWVELSGLIPDAVERQIWVAERRLNPRQGAKLSGKVGESRVQEVGIDDNLRGVDLPYQPYLGSDAK